MSKRTKNILMGLVLLACVIVTGKLEHDALCDGHFGEIEPHWSCD